MMRRLIVPVALLLLVAAATGRVAAQSGYDRPGGDYARATVPSGDPALCASRCEHERSCRSWSFLYPTTSGTPAMCDLKRKVQPPVRSTCCVSGVRGAGVVEPRLGGGLEYSIDRAGGDYHTFEIKPDFKGKPCEDACRADKRCRAWTYRRPGYGTAGARCYLKNVIKPPRRRPCCISGVVR
jgi:hypothetical protein